MPRGLSTLIVIAVIVGSALLGQQKMKPEPAAAGQPRAEEPGYAAKDAELIETGVDGRPLYRLNARMIRQSPADGSVQLDGVRMSYRGESTNQWSLSATQGVLRENNERIELAGDVRVVGIVAGTSDLAQIRTERLSFDAVSEIATTSEPVTLALGRNELHGTGLYASLKDRQVRLESGVHGSFSPQ
jgi:lipopolysaccharide export system protein LptC